MGTGENGPFNIPPYSWKEGEKRQAQRVKRGFRKFVWERQRKKDKNIHIYRERGGGEIYIYIYIYRERERELDI